MAGVPVRNRLHVLVSSGRLKQIRELLSQDPNAVELIDEPAGVFGYTPIHEAVSGRRADILRVLLAYGGNVDVLSNGRYTPVQIAASIGDVECIKVLLEFDADLSVTDEFGKTPIVTAELNRRRRAAKVLRTHEIKKLASVDNPELRTILEGLQRGQDIEDNCFEDALEIAVSKNSRKAVGYLVLHGARNLEKCMQAALLKSNLQRTAVLLLLCHAAKIDDKELVRLICKDLTKDKQSGGFSTPDVNIFRRYLPKEWNQTLNQQKLREMREAVCCTDMAFPVAVAFGLNNYETTWILLSEIYCKDNEGEADWHGLALSRLQSDWIKSIIQYKKLILSHNLLEVFPHGITKMSSLTRLDVSKNSIEEVPKALFELKYLRTLNLSSNQIRLLPKVDEWSKSIKMLNLKNNILRSVDSSIAGSALEDLNLSDNKLSSVQPCICEISTLQVLDLSQNQKITILPPELAKLSKLNFLGIDKMDQITDPPPGLRAPTSVLLSHLRARLRHSEPYYTMKLMIVGLANRGKTTLMHRINKDYAFDMNTSTQGVDICDIKIGRSTFKCWDFAGQEEYYATHQCFLSQRSLYLLVWNVEERDEGIASLKPWLDNLQFRVPLSLVIIVGTHLDKIDASERAQSFEDDIIDKVFRLVSQYREIVCQKEMIMLTTCSKAREHIEDCKSRNEKLRNLITAVADNVTVDGKTKSPKVMGEMVPSSYLTLAKMVDERRAELEREGTIPLLRRCQFQNLIYENATKHPRDYFVPEDIDVATEFLHNIGLILHYNDPNQDLRDLYFISPSWLCDLMAKVVTVKEAHSFIRDGMLYEKDIPFIIDENQRFPREFYPKYLRLLARFQIACRVDSKRILVPSRLPVTNPLKSTASYEPSHTLIRIHSFSCIPNGFWSRFISRFLLYLKEMLNINRENPEQNSHDQTFDEDEGRSDDVIDKSMKEERKSSSECFEGGKQEEMEKSTSEAEISTGQIPDQRTGKESEVDGFAERTQVDGIHNGWIGTDDNTANGREEGSGILGLGHLDTEKYVRYPDCTSPPLILNACLFQDDDVPPCDGPSPSDDNPDSRDITPISFGGDSSLSSPISTSSHDHSRAPSSNTFDDIDHVSPQPNIDSQNGGNIATPHRPCFGVASNGMNQPRQTKKSNEDLEESFDDLVDLPYLLSRRYLICWRNGLLFKHPLLYLSVSLLPHEHGRERIETKVSRSLLGYRALAFIVDHIRTLIKEWFPGLEGTDGFNPYVSQFVPCPICLNLGVYPPHHFDVVDCLKESLTKDYMVCENAHTPQVVRLSELCPDLLFMDLDASLQLNPANLRFEESEHSLLGSGQYGKVYSGTYDGENAAVKVYNFKLEESPNYLEALDHFYEVRQEAVVLSRIRHHPNVISFYGVAARPKFCIVIELAMQGTLRTVLKENKKIERIVVYRIAQQVAGAVAHLHSRGIIHRDLKSDNVLLFSLERDSDVNVKLADFGTANFIDPVGLKYFTGTPGFIAPEIFEYSKTEEYNEMVDVYSYAMVLYELLSKRRPFNKAQSALEINEAIKEGRRPIFYDLPDTKVRLLTLTELMLKCWVQEAIKRPKLHEVYRQMKSPSFCLLYGKVPLRSANTPRQLCFVRGTNEVWISCDDRDGASVLVVDVKSSELKQKFIPENKSLSKAKESFFNIIAIHDIDKNHAAVVLRGVLDYVSIYSTERKKLVDSYQVADHYIRSLTVSENHVIIGCNDGSFSVVTKKDFVKGRLDRVSVTVNEKRAISSVTTNKQTDDAGTKIILGCDKYMYKYPLSPPDFGEVIPEMRPTKEKKLICEMHVCEDNGMLFISHNGSPVISTININSMELIGQIDCSSEVRMLVPNSDVNDQRVTTFCVSGDTLWVGTGSGHILVYEIKSDSAPSFLTWLKPYKLEVRFLIACSIEGMDPSRLVVSIGKEVNITALCYDRNGLCLLTGSLPVDPSDPALERRNSKAPNGRKYSANLQNKADEFDVKKMMLTWDSPGASALKKLIE